jgi:hypothetical protein
MSSSFSDGSQPEATDTFYKIWTTFSCHYHRAKYMPTTDLLLQNF